MGKNGRRDEIRKQAPHKMDLDRMINVYILQR